MSRHLLLSQTFTNTFTTKQQQSLNKLLLSLTQNILKLASILIIYLFAFQNTTVAQDTSISGFIYMGEHAGNRYYCSYNSYNWNDAQALVAQHGGHMLTINSWEENSYVSARIMANAAWLGYSNHNSNNWDWMNGQSSNISNWASGEPNGSGYGAVIIKNYGHWKDRYHGNAYEVVMEIPNCAPALNICNNGNCAVNLYDWVASGDIFLRTLSPGQCHQVISENGHMYRIVDTDNVWGSLTIDEHYTVSGCEDQTWNVAPCPGDDSCPEECPAGNFSGTDYLGTFNGSRYYKKSSGNVNYWDAHNFAQSIGGHLITINSAEENNFLKNATDGKVWLGLSDANSEGSFSWDNGEPLNYTNWNSGEPNDYGNGEDYTEFLSNGLWNDITENHAASCVVEIPCECCTPKVTICNDGNCPANLYHSVATGDIFLTTLNPGQCHDVDSRDGEMYRMVDTNNDWNNLTFDEHYTVSGCENQTWNVNPCPDDNSCPQECPVGNFDGTDYLGTFNGSRYYRKANDCITYWEAYNYAESIGGQLVTINSAEEDNFISNTTDGPVWIGLTDANSEGSFAWNTGEALNYTNWKAGQPNDYNNDQDFTVIYDNKWYDIDEYYHAWSVVEIPCDCCTSTLEICNDGKCPIDLYHWAASGDALLATIKEGECFEVNTTNDQTYRVVDSNTDWDHIIFDESYTVASCENQRWGVNPCPSDDSCPEECPVGNFDETEYLGTFNGSRYYKKSGGAANYQDALAFADSIGGYLITINSAEENEFLKNVTSGSVWLGLSDANSEGNFEWNNGDSLNYTNWNAGEPNDWGEGEDYVQFYSNGKWNDINEYAYLSCVVEIPCDCCTSNLIICNEGVCVVNLFQQDPNGDIFLTILTPDACFETVAQEGNTYYLVHQQLTPGAAADECESYTVTGCEDQIWGAEPPCPLPLVCFAEVLTDISFPNRTDGSIIAQADGGTPPFRYVWSTGDTTQEVEGLGAGTYTVRISDASGFACAASVTLSDPVIIGSLIGGDGSRNGISNNGNTQELLVTPIELLDFTVRNIGRGQIQIDWETLNEHENQKFVIERSPNGTDFQAISTIDGKGSIHEATPYDHMDKRPLAGRNYYRIKKVYFNGYFEHTEIKSAVIKGNSQKEVFVYPNPTPDVIAIKSADAFKQDVIVKLMNEQGVQLLNYPIPAGNNFESIDLTVYPPGIYYVHLIYENEMNTTFKVVKTDY